MNEKAYASFNTPEGELKMSKETLARGFCLTEALHIIDKKSSNLGISLYKK